MIRSSLRIAGPRRLVILAIAALIPALAGCEAGYNAPTQEWHQPTDGAGTVHNNIAVRNVFVLGAPLGRNIPAGHSAGVFLALFNEGSADRLLSMSAPGTARSVTLPGGAVPLASQQSVLLTGPGAGGHPAEPDPAPHRRLDRPAGHDLPERRYPQPGGPDHAAGPVLLDVLGAAEPDPEPVAEQAPQRQGQRVAHCHADAEPVVLARPVQTEGSNLYPSPRTVRMCAGFAGSASTLARSRLTWTSSVLVSPT